MTTPAPEIVRQVIPEHPGDGGRLGRHIEHDERSRGFAYAMGATGVVTLQSLRRKRRIGPFDQGERGSCTGNATAGAVCTAPFKHKFSARSQRSPLRLYSLATKLDEFPGVYPPDDTGSSGLAAAKAAQQLKHITSYQHAFNLDAAIHAAANPGVGLIFGINWYDSFDRPDTNGVIDISPGAQIRGGHEIQGDGIVLATPATYSGDDLVWMWQSWGEWGLGGTGAFAMRVRTLDRLLQEQGDCTILIP